MTNSVLTGTLNPLSQSLCWCDVVIDASRVQTEAAVISRPAWCYSQTSVTLWCCLIVVAWWQHEGRDSQWRVCISYKTWSTWQGVTAVNSKVPLSHFSRYSFFVTTEIHWVPLCLIVWFCKSVRCVGYWFFPRASPDHVAEDSCGFVDDLHN